MKLIELQIQGLRKIVGLVMPLKAGVNIIVGKNRQGKSSIIDAISLLLEGSSNFRQSMINDESDGIQLLGEFDDGMIVKRIIPREGSPRLVVEQKKGDVKFKINSPQSMLKALVNHIAVSPMDFVRAKATEKAAILKKNTGLDFTEIDKKIKEKETERTFVSRTINAHGELVLPEYPGEKKSAKELNDKKSEVIRRNDERKAVVQVLREVQEDMIKSLNRNREKLFSLSETINDDFSLINKHNDSVVKSEKLDPKLQARFKKFYEEFAPKFAEFSSEIDAVLDKFPPYETNPDHLIYVETESFEEIDKEIEGIDVHNEKVANYELIKRNIETRAQEVEKRDKLSKEIEALRKEKAEMIQKSDIGIENLRIEDDGIYINDIFSEDWSHMEALKYAVTIGIHNQKLRAVAMDDFEHFDKDSQGDFIEWLEKNDIQAIIASVGEVPENPDDDKYYIVDGEIKNTNVEQPTKETLKRTEGRTDKELPFDERTGGHRKESVGFDEDDF